MKRPIRIFQFIVFVAVLVLTTSGCRRSETGGEKPIVRVGHLGITADAPTYVAIEKGFFDAEGIRIKLHRFNSPGVAINSLASGDLDFHGAAGWPTLFTKFVVDPTFFKVPISAIETRQLFTARILVPKDSPIKTLQDLKGKRIGTYKSPSTRLYIKLILSKYLDPEKDITLIELANPSLQVPALAEGKFDALYTYDPHGTVALKKGVAKVLVEAVRVTEFMDPFPAFGNAMSNKFAFEHREVARRFMKALNRAAQWIDGNIEETKKICMKYTPVKDEEIALACGMYKWQLLGEEDQSLIQKLADLFSEHGLLTKKVEVKEMMFSQSVFEEAKH